MKLCKISLFKEPMKRVIPIIQSIHRNKDVHEILPDGKYSLDKAVYRMDRVAKHWHGEEYAGVESQRISIEHQHI